MTKLAIVHAGTICDFPQPIGDLTLQESLPDTLFKALVEVPDAAQIGWTWDGKTTTAPVAPDGPTLASVQSSLSVDIDKQAQAQRDLYVTPGGAQSATYLLKQTQAAQALSAQASNTSANMTAAALASLYPYLANEIGITVDPTSKVAATDVYGVARAVQAVLLVWQPINLAIEAMRLKTKASITAAMTNAAAQAAHDAVSWPALS